MRIKGTLLPSDDKLFCANTGAKYSSIGLWRKNEVYIENTPRCKNLGRKAVNLWNMTFFLCLSLV